MQVELEYDRRIQLAMLHNQISPLRMLRLSNDAEQEYRDLRVSISFTPAIAPTLTLDVAKIAPEATLNIGSEKLEAQLSLEHLISQQERQDGRLIVQVAQQDVVLAEKQFPIEVLARNEWSGGDSPPDLLASFVFPNHPTVVELAQKARVNLQNQTGDGRFDGYQSRDPARVVAMAKAAYGSISASPSYVRFEVASVQKIKSPEQVLEEQDATSLDTALLIAATLERMGLDALLVVMGEHAFVGVWLGEYRLPTPWTDDPIPVRKRVDSKEALVFPVPVNGVTFDEACGDARRQLDEAAHFAFVVDVNTARNAGVSPLSHRFPESSETVAASEAVDDEVEVLFEPKSSGPKTRLDRWKASLLDLSLRNRLLNHRENKTVLPLCEHEPTDMFEHLSAGWKLKLAHRTELPTPEPGKPPVGKEEFFAKALHSGRTHVNLDLKQFDRRVLELYRTGRSLVQETGSSPVYLALGMLNWYESPSSEVRRRSPVLLLPVSIERASAKGPYYLAHSGDEPMVNITLLKKLESDFGLKTAGLEELPENESGVDVSLLFRRLRSVINGMSRWEVLPESAVAVYSFQKFLMWLDLERNTKALLQNPVVGHIFNEGHHKAFSLQAPLLDPSTLDDQRPAADDLSVVDADSSQLVAVHAALDGNSFVLQGPPGTGKSQTITNLIAQALGRGKTVLFVSEKRAALEVVHSRLQRVGLGAFCLEAHSEKASKMGIIEQLQEPFAYSWQTTQGKWSNHSNELQSLRIRLNKYSRSLHNEGPWGESLFDAISKLIGLKDAPRIHAPFNNIKLNETTVKAMKRSVQELARATQVVGVPCKQSWSMIHRNDWGPAWEREVTGHLESTLEACDAILKASEDVAQVLGLQWSPPSISELAKLDTICDVLLACPAPPPGFLDGSWKERESDVREVVELVEKRQMLSSDLKTRFTDQLYKINLTEEHARFAQWVNAFFLLAFFLLFGARRRLKKIAVDGNLPSNKQITTDLATAQDVVRLKRQLDEREPQVKGLLGEHWKGNETNWQELHALPQWSARFQAVVRDVPWGNGDPMVIIEQRKRMETLVTEGATLLQPGAPTGQKLQRFKEHFQQWHKASKTLCRLLQIDAETWSKEELSAIQGHLKVWSNSIPQLRDWCDWRRAWSNTRELEVLRQACWRGELEPSELVPAFDRALRQWWVETAMSKDADLRHFRGLTHEEQIKRFKQQDMSAQKLAQMEIQARLAARLPDPQGPGEMGRLRREFKKKKRHMPVRKLFSEIPNVLLRIKPCVLMSPLSVARYLDPEMEGFDLVVFDEASQIPPWDAIGAIARGKQVVVVGDSKQLPPTSFFSRADSDEVDDEDQIDLESILDECVAAGLPSLHLTWHYRSRHENLIAFSNYHYYDNRLHTFPAAAREVPDLGVKHVHIPNGYYDRGKSRTNQAEAEAVVAEIVRRLKSPKLKSDTIGVVTFSMAQQRLVEDLIDEERRKHTDIENHFTSAVAEPVFIKNLESVQGDERDVMLFSIGYGPDRTGKIPMNFGPLNRQGGERRLNVAITRARKQLMVFSTLRADQIDLSKTRSVGVRHLKTFLDYAARGPAAIDEAVQLNPLADFDSPFERQVSNSLEAHGYQVHRQVGCAGYRIDLAVVDPNAPGTYILGIECDGANYHSAKTARDRDRIRQAVLEGLGWQIHRIWSTDWWHNSERETQRMIAVIEPLLREKAAPKTTPPSMPTTVVTPFSGPDRVEMDWHSEVESDWPSFATPWEEPANPKGGSRDIFKTQEGFEVLQNQILYLARGAGPITFDHLQSLLVPAWGFKSRGKLISGRIKDAMRELESKRLLYVNTSTDTVWASKDREDAFQGFRYVNAASTRDWKHIPLIELANAASWIIKQGVSVEEDELLRELSRVFGIKRLGKAVRERIQQGTNLLIQTGRAEVVDEYYRLKNNSPD